ncbi:hypothetical protein AB0420_11420 [Streptomyces caelestis]|uniref:Uncharacterized protein n=1 Tax=Streptomyces heliomycini TaxID=284032 RepID=A0ABV5L9N2_9ACTN
MLRTLLALITRGTGRHRKPQKPTSTPLAARLDAGARGARVVRRTGRGLPSRYVIEAETVDLVRPYFRAFEEQTRRQAEECAA